MKITNKSMLLIAVCLMSLKAVCRADSTTPRLTIVKPSVGSANWGPKLNSNFDLIDAGVAVLTSTNGFTQRQYLYNGLQVSSTTNGTPLMFNTQTSSVTIGNTNANVILYGASSVSDAPAGAYGEYISSFPASFISFTASNTWHNYASIVLTAGDWDVSGQLSYNPVTAGSFTNAEVAISSYSADTSLDHQWGMNYITWTNPSNFPASGVVTNYIIPYRMNLPTTTTVYLKGKAVYQTGTPNMRVGYIRARRIR